VLPVNSVEEPLKNEESDQNITRIDGENTEVAKTE